MKIFKGIWPALATPGNPDNTVNVAALHDLIDYLIDKQVDGFYIGGTTGEGIFMPVAQRKILAEAALSHINGRVPVILHAGAISIDDAIDLAQHAQQHGAAGISSIIPPLYHSLDVVATYYRQLATSVEIPFIAYFLNATLSATALMNKLEGIPNLAGSKYTGPNMYEFREILDLGEGEWTMFSGMDEQSVYAAMMGATGAIGSTLNFMPGVYKQIHAYVQADEYAKAQDLQLRANKITQIMISVGFPGALKEVLSHILGTSTGQPRLPGLPLTDEQRKTLHKKLEKTDFKELIAM